MMITHVEAIPFRLPYRRPLKMVVGDLTAAEHVLIRVHTDEGFVGQAEAPSRPMFYGESLTSITAAVRDWFGPGLAGTDPFAVQRARTVLERVAANNTAKGALDLALHDLRGQAAGISCQRLLGGFGAPLRVTHMLSLDEPAAVAAEAARMREQHGISVFKVKIGHGGAADTSVVAAVRDAVGADALIYLDANQAYTAEEARTILTPLAEKYQISWVEEPSPASDPSGRQRLSTVLSVPVLGDESCTTIAEVAHEVGSGAARMVSIKTARTGFTTSADIMALTTGLGAQLLCGSQGDSGIGTLATLAFGSAHAATAKHPAELSYYLTLSDDLLAEPPAIRDGYLYPGDTPGLGIALDHEKLQRYRLDSPDTSRPHTVEAGHG